VLSTLPHCHWILRRGNTNKGGLGWSQDRFNQVAWFFRRLRKQMKLPKMKESLQQYHVPCSIVLTSMRLNIKQMKLTKMKESSQQYHVPCSIVLTSMHLNMLANYGLLHDSTGGSFHYALVLDYNNRLGKNDNESLQTS